MFLEVWWVTEGLHFFPWLLPIAMCWPCLSPRLLPVAGYRHIQLLSNTGNPMPNCTLFVHVAITNKRGGGVSSQLACFWLGWKGTQVCVLRSLGLVRSLKPLFSCSCRWALHLCTSCSDLDSVLKVVLALQSFFQFGANFHWSLHSIWRCYFTDIVVSWMLSVMFRV